ncbi:ROK family protein [Myxococcota bacterium]|nr:ROK family protein [Myxococcota bacterium]
MSLLGLDIGGTKRVLVVGDHTARPLVRRRAAMRFCGEWRADLDAIVADARDLLEEARAAGAGPLEAIGVAAPGPVDRLAGVLHNPPNLPGWRDVPLGPILGRAFGVPVRVENDANAAALAEYRFGAGRGSTDLVYLTMSTGVGGGVVAGGRLVVGAHGFAGELGHVPIVRGGLRCHCGLRGCLEAYVGGQAWAKRLRRVVPETSRVFALAGGERGRIGSEALLAAAREGDDFARAELARWLDFLAFGIAGIVMTFDPERIVLGTIAVAAGDSLCFAPLRERVGRLVWPGQAARLQILPALLGEALPEQAALAVAGAGATDGVA